MTMPGLLCRCPGRQRSAVCHVSDSTHTLSKLADRDMTAHEIASEKGFLYGLARMRACPRLAGIRACVCEKYF